MEVDTSGPAAAVGIYSAWLQKTKSDSARAKWFSGTTRRYFTIDFDSQMLFYSSSEDQKRISPPVLFRDFVCADWKIPAASTSKLLRSGSKGFASNIRWPLKRSTAAAEEGCSFVLKTSGKELQLRASTPDEAARWVSTLNVARDVGRGLRSESRSHQNSAAGFRGGRCCSARSAMDEDLNPHGSAAEQGSAGAMSADERKDLIAALAATWAQTTSSATTDEAVESAPSSDRCKDSNGKEHQSNADTDGQRVEAAITSCDPAMKNVLQVDEQVLAAPADIDAQRVEAAIASCDPAIENALPVDEPALAAPADIDAQQVEAAIASCDPAIENAWAVDKPALAAPADISTQRMEAAVASCAPATEAVLIDEPVLAVPADATTHQVDYPSNAEVGLRSKASSLATATPAVSRPGYATTVPLARPARCSVARSASAVEPQDRSRSVTPAQAFDTPRLLMTRSGARRAATQSDDGSITRGMGLASRPRTLGSRPVSRSTSDDFAFSSSTTESTGLVGRAAVAAVAAAVRRGVPVVEYPEPLKSMVDVDRNKAKVCDVGNEIRKAAAQRVPDLSADPLMEAAVELELLLVPSGWDSEDEEIKEH